MFVTWHILHIFQECVKFFPFSTGLWRLGLCYHPAKIKKKLQWLLYWLKWKFPDQPFKTLYNPAPNTFSISFPIFPSPCHPLISAILVPPPGHLPLSHRCSGSGCSCLDPFSYSLCLATPVHAAGGSWNAAGLQEPLASLSPAASNSFLSCASCLSILHYNYPPHHQL